MPTHRKNLVPSSVLDNLRNRLFLRFYRTNWLRLGGAILVGLYGAFFWVFLVLGFVATVFIPTEGAEAMWLLSAGCVVVTAFGFWLYSSP